jgi:hypothetical protein
MRMQSFGLIATACLVWITAANAGEPTVADLIKLVPNVQSSDPKVKSIEFVCSGSRQGFRVRHRVVYKAPNHFSLLLSDAADGTPLEFIADRQALYYDPIRPSVTRINNCATRVEVGNDGEFSWSIFQIALISLDQGHRVKTTDGININLRSQCEQKGISRRVVKIGPTHYRLYLSSIDPLTTLVCTFDMSREQPFEGMKVFLGTSHESMLSFEKLEINQPLADEEFRFPDRALSASKLNVRSSSGDDLEWAKRESLLMSNSMRARGGAIRPGLQHSRQLADLGKLDWDATVANDRKYAALLRELLPVNGYPILPDLVRPDPSPVVDVTRTAGR